MNKVTSHPVLFVKELFGIAIRVPTANIHEWGTGETNILTLQCMEYSTGKGWRQVRFRIVANFHII